MILLNEYSSEVQVEEAPAWLEIEVRVIAEYTLGEWREQHARGNDVHQHPDGYWYLRHRFLGRARPR